MVQHHLAGLLGSGGQGSAALQQQSSHLLYPQEQSHRQWDTLVQEHLGTWSPQLLEMKGTTVFLLWE